MSTPPKGTPARGHRQRLQFEREPTNAYPPEMDVGEIFQSTRSEDSAVTTLMDSKLVAQVRAMPARGEVAVSPAEGAAPHTPRPVHTPRPEQAAQVAHTPRPAQVAHTPRPAQVAHTPQPAQVAHTPRPEQVAHTPQPSLQRKLGAVSLALPPGRHGAMAPAPGAFAHGESDDGYLHTMTELPGSKRRRRAGVEGQSRLGGLARWGFATLALLFLAGGLVAAGAIAYVGTPRPALVLALAPVGGLLVLLAGTFLLHLLGVRQWLAGATALLVVAAIALATEWTVRLGFPVGLAESIFHATLGDVIAELQRNVRLAREMAPALFQGYQLALWSGELVLFLYIMVRCFGFLRGRSAS